MKQHFTITVSREGQWWVGRAQELVGAATEVRRLADLEIEVRDLLAGLLDMDDDDFDLSWDMSEILGSDGQAVWERYGAERDELAVRKAQFEADRVAALRALCDAGVSARDSAVLVGLSHQRVAQLLNA